MDLWLWRYMNEKVSLRRRVVSSTYGDNGFGWYPCKPSGPYGQSFWRYIYKGWSKLFWGWFWFFHPFLARSSASRWSSSRSVPYFLRACYGYGCYYLLVQITINEWMVLLFGKRFHPWCFRGWGYSSNPFQQLNEIIWSFYLILPHHSFWSIGEFPLEDYLEDFNSLKSVMVVWEALHRSILTCNNLQRRAISWLALFIGSGQDRTGLKTDFWWCWGLWTGPVHSRSGRNRIGQTGLDLDRADFEPSPRSFSSARGLENGPGLGIGPVRLASSRWPTFTLAFCISLICLDSLTIS